VVVLCGENSFNWISTDLACALSGVATMTLDSSLHENSIRQVLARVHVRAVFCNSQRQDLFAELAPQGTPITLISETKELNELKSDLSASHNSFDPSLVPADPGGDALFAIQVPPCCERHIGFADHKWKLSNSKIDRPNSRQMACRSLI
jgi:hypothetical protein